MTYITNFLNEDTGAVTVDWVVLTASLVGLGLATMAVVSQGAQDAATDIDTQLKHNHIINTSFDVAPTALSSPMGNFVSSSDQVVVSMSCAPAGQPGSDETCADHEITPGYENDYYTMSDGTEWIRTTTQYGGQTISYSSVDGVATGSYSDEDGNTYANLSEIPDVVTWTDGNGDPVEAPTVLN